MSEANDDKIAIIGAGLHANAIASACAQRQLGSPVAVNPSGDPAAGAGARIIIFAGEAGSVPSARELLLRALAAAPEAIVLIAAEPCEALASAALKWTGLPPARVMGTGTIVESLRFRALIAQRCRVAIEEVHGYVAGGRGDLAVPLWSSAAIAGIPLHEWAVPQHGRLSVRDRTEIFQRAKSTDEMDAAGAANAAQAAADIIEALLHDQNRVLPITGHADGFHDITGVCVALPRIVNAKGIESPLPIRLSANEEAGLKEIADKIKAQANLAGTASL